MRSLCLLIAATVCAQSAVTTIRVPNGGIQPQVLEFEGVVHMIYFSGAPEKGDLFYVTSRDYGATFSKPIQVNHTPGSAIAVGNIRGAQMAVGRNGRIHVAWNGTEPAGHLPMLYTRLNDAGTAFEPERNLIHSAYGLDGGGSVAADYDGNVYVFWHAPIPGRTGEQNRRVWIAKSTDEGKTFASERIAFDRPIGACGCCGMKAYAAGAAGIYVLFRSADQVVNRDIWLLTSVDGGKTFRGSDVSHWNIGACVMSSADLVETAKGMIAAWETEKQVYFGRVSEKGVDTVAAAPGTPRNRKYPVLAVNGRGETLFAWTEGTAWKKPGTVEWEVLDRAGRTASDGKAPGEVPVWSVTAAFAKPDGDFVVVY